MSNFLDIPLEEPYEIQLRDGVEWSAIPHWHHTLTTIEVPPGPNEIRYCDENGFCSPAFIVVPEPSLVMMLIVGMVAVELMRRWRNK